MKHTLILVAIVTKAGVSLRTQETLPPKTRLNAGRAGLLAFRAKERIATRKDVADELLDATWPTLAGAREVAQIAKLAVLTPSQVATRANRA